MQVSEKAPFTDAERNHIRLLAMNDMSALPLAAEAYESLLTRTRKVFRRDPYFEFIGEVMSPCPDYSYRALMRARILEDTP